MCLTSNIFTVSAVRTIALVRSAKSVGFVLTLFTSFLLFDAVISVKNGPIIPFFIVLLISFLLYLPNLWVTKLDSTLETKMVTHSAALAFLTASIYLFLFFWPVTVVIGSIFLTVSIYVILGLAQSYWDGHLFSATIREYLIVGIIVFIAMIIAVGQGLSSVGIVTDLNIEDAKRLHGSEPISLNEVLEAYAVVQDKKFHLSFY